MYKSQEVVQVNIAAESGEMGVLAHHVPSIEQLKPGIVEVIEESGSTKQFFRTFYTIGDSGGFIVRSLTECYSFRWIRRCSAQLGHEHQRRRGLPH